MKAIVSTIRRPILSGYQPVAGLWLARSELVEGEIRERVLACWRPGARLHRFPEGYLLVWRETESRACESLPGWPLRRYGNTLSSAELSDSERKRLPPGDLWLVQGAELIALGLAAAEPVDPAAWIELDGYALYDTFDCSASVLAPTAYTVVKRDVREIVGDAVPPPSAESRAFMAHMLARRAGQPSAEGMAGMKAAGGLLGGGLLSLFAGLFSRSGAGRMPARSRGTAPSGGIAPRRPAAPGPQRWRQWLVQMALVTRVARLMGWRQAAYLQKMMKLFEDGDMREALRHAIPLGGDSPSLGQRFGGLGPRQDLSLSRGNGASTSIGLDNDMEAHLRKVYRQTFERLDREGRIDEAMFVLAELLKSKPEALDYLERHERYGQAAELALAWDSPPETIVRLLVLNGEWEKAVLVARRDNAFSGAILLLEKRRPELAVQLRLDWAEALVAKGDWLAAVDVVWPVASARERAAEWLWMAESAQGELAARALVQRALLLPDTLERYGERLLALGDGDDSEARFELGQALLGLKHNKLNPALQSMARALLPALMADRICQRNTITPGDLNQLLRIGGDPLLNADLPDLSLPANNSRGKLQNSFTRWQAPEKGLQAITDVVPLASGCYLIAQGEAGVALVNRHGEVLRHHNVPANCLVIADSQQVVLALAQRDTVWRVMRLDLVSHAVVDLGVLPLTHFAREFDGIGWTVVSQGRLLVLDTTRTLQDVMWHVSDLPGPVLALYRQATAEHIAIATPIGKELWKYQLPGRRLQAREELPTWCEDQEYSLLTLNAVVHVRLQSETDKVLELAYRFGHKKETLRLPEALGQPEGIAQFCSKDWLVLGLAYGSTVEWLMIHLHTGKCCGQLSWPDAEAPAMRFSEDSLCFFDRSGRLLRLDCADSQVETLVLRLDPPKVNAPSRAAHRPDTADNEAARKAEERARAVRETLARKAAEEAAAKTSRE